MTKPQGDSLRAPMEQSLGMTKMSMVLKRLELVDQVQEENPLIPDHHQGLIAQRQDV